MYCACHAKFICADPLPTSHACHRFWNCYKPSRFAHFWQGAEPLAPASKHDIQQSREHVVFLASKCASRRNAVHLLNISASGGAPLAGWPRTRRFSEPVFRPSGATKNWRNTVLRDFSTFSRSSLIFFLLLFSSLLRLSAPLLSHLSVLSEV